MSDDAVAASITSQLARLDRSLLRDALEAANAAEAKRRQGRRQQIRDVVRRVRDELLPEHHDREVARIIDALARGYRIVGLTPVLRAAVMAMLLSELKTLGDMPGFEMLRKMLQ